MVYLQGLAVFEPWKGIERLLLAGMARIKPCMLHVNPSPHQALSLPMRHVEHRRGAELAQKRRETTWIC